MQIRARIKIKREEAANPTPPQSPTTFSGMGLSGVIWNGPWWGYIRMLVRIPPTTHTGSPPTLQHRTLFCEYVPSNAEHYPTPWKGQHGPPLLSVRHPGITFQTNGWRLQCVRHRRSIIISKSRLCQNSREGGRFEGGRLQSWGNRRIEFPLPSCASICCRRTETSPGHACLEQRRLVGGSRHDNVWVKPVHRSCRGSFHCDGGWRLERAYILA